MLYGGFFATAMWMNYLVWRNFRAKPNAQLVQLIPVGYEYGYIGIGLFVAAGFADMLWHTLLGIEVNIEALLSPPHMLLFAGGLLIVSSPLRSAWTNTKMQAPKFLEFLPGLFSLLATVSAISFFQQYMWAFSRVLHGTAQSEHFASIIIAGNSFDGRFMLERANLAEILVTNAILIGASLIAMRRFQLPVGAFTLLFGINTAMMVGMVGFAKYPEQIVAGFIAGALADVLYVWLRPNENRVYQLRLFAFLVPLGLWSLHFLATMLHGGTTFSLQIFSGITIMSAFAGFGLSLLIAPAAIKSEKPNSHA